MWEVEGEQARLVAAAPTRAGGATSVAVAAAADLPGDLAARRPVFRTEAAGAPLLTGTQGGAELGATLRAAWRGLALTVTDPLALTHALNEVFLAERPSDEAFATVCCARVPPDRASATFVVAGHPMPLLLREGVDLVDLPCGPPLGLGGDGDWQEVTVALGRTWTLLFYTDGLVEARNRPGGPDRFGEQGLIERLAELPTPAGLDGAGLDTVLAHVQELSGERFADDVAVVLIRHQPDPA